MAALCGLILLLSISYVTSQTQQSKSFLIKPSSSSSLLQTNGIAITTGDGVSIPSNKDIWDINVLTQYGADLSLSLNSQWGFDSNAVSSLHLTIDGNTSASSYKYDGEMIVIFSVNDQYFAKEISLDRRKTSHKECPKSFDPLISRNVDQMINSKFPDRSHRFCMNEVNTPIYDGTDYWTNVASVYKQPAKWPMTMSITNDPLSNKVSYAWTDDENAPNKVSSTYSGTFSPNSGMKIFFSGDSPNENFQIFSIEITYEYTSKSTINPSLSPTKIPTLKPSNFPTTKPTKKPSFQPTNRPTFVPSQFPSLYPTKFPTSNPLKSPTLNPSLVPTKSPSQFMSYKPTYFPSIQPSKIPTFETNEPSIYPTMNPMTVSAVVSTETTQLPIIEVSESNKKNETVKNFAHLAPTNEDDITWIHACLIISSIFIFFSGWVGIFCFIYSQKKKRQRQEETAQKQAKTSINHLTVIGQKHTNEDEEGSKSGYHSQSALDIDAVVADIADDHSMTQHHHVARFLNIVKTSDIFEGGGGGNGHNLSRQVSKLSRRTTETYCVNGVNLSDVDLSETVDSDSESSDVDYTETTTDTNSHLQVIGMNDFDQRKDSHSIDI